MDLVHMATCSIRWAILRGTESNQVVDLDGLGAVKIKVQGEPIVGNSFLNYR